MNNKEILQECFAQLANEMGVEQNLELFASMTNLVTPVAPDASPESQRDIKLEVYSGGKVTGEFRDFKNIDLDFKGILDLLNSSNKFWGGMAIGAAFNLTPYLLLLGIAKVIYDGYCKDITSDNAEVLYAMYKLPRKRFTKTEVLASYELEFGKSLPERHWARSLDMFLKLEIISKSRGDKYKLEETIRAKGKL
jgi:hypothetical protein